MGDLNFSDNCWKDNTAELKHSRRFLECVGDNFLAEVIEDSTRKGTLLDLVLMNREELVKDMKVRGSLGCSDCDMGVE